MRIALVLLGGLALVAPACGGSDKDLAVVPVAADAGADVTSDDICDKAALGCSNMNIGGFLVLPACCIDERTCGVDTSALGRGGCQQTLFPMRDAAVGDAGDVFLSDGGVIDINTASCSGILLGIGAITLPGCCRPDGTCGGSTAVFGTSSGSRSGIPVQCASYAELQSYLDQHLADAAGFTGPFGGGLRVPADPGETCTYAPSEAPPAPALSAPEAGPADAHSNVAVDALVAAVVDAQVAPPIDGRVPPIVDAQVFSTLDASALP